jgi:eukaryotic-like serine/threonine-protein kinase
MALDAVNAIGAFAILNPRPLDAQQKIVGVAGAALLPGIIGLAVPLIIASRAGGQTSTGQGQVVVPDLAGKTQADASSKLAQLELNPTISGAISLDEQKGLVVDQTPAAGTLVNPKSGVALVIGSGVAQSGQSVVPDLNGSTKDDAERQLKAVQLTLGAATTAVSPDGQKDKVVSQDPKAAALVATGSAVSIVIGTGTVSPSTARSSGGSGLKSP